MPEHFYDPLGDDQHDKFQQWRDAHPHGFVINRKSQSAGTLHRANCHLHMGDSTWTEDDYGKRLTRVEKICSQTATN